MGAVVLTPIMWSQIPNRATVSDTSTIPYLRMTCKNSPNEHMFGVTCITHFPLETWKSMTKDEIRSCLPARPGPLKRFKAARSRSCKFKAALVQFSQQQVLENVKRTDAPSGPFVAA